MPDLSLRVGEAYRLELPGRGSAGYSWQTDVDGPEGVLEIRRGSSGPPPSAGPGGPPPSSGSLPEILDQVAAGAGRVRLRLELRRSWEEGPPLDEQVYDVVVS